MNGGIFLFIERRGLLRSRCPSYPACICPLWVLAGHYGTETVPVQVELRSVESRGVKPHPIFTSIQRHEDIFGQIGLDDKVMKDKLSRSLPFHQLEERLLPQAPAQIASDQRDKASKSRGHTQTLCSTGSENHNFQSFKTFQAINMKSHPG